MNTHHPDPPSSANDQSLRQSLRDALASAPRDTLEPLEARALQQWQRLHQDRRQPRGPLAALQLGWRLHPAWFTSGLLTLALAALLAARLWAPADPGIDELMQPDVLSLISMGEL